MTHLSPYFLERQAKAMGMGKPVEEKKVTGIKKVSEKKKAQLKADKPKRDELQQFFVDRIAESRGKCLECNEPINKAVYAFAMMAVAHCLPKRNGQFPSVATHPENSLELCVTNGCHQKYDSSWEAASSMKVWPLAVQKFIKIYPSIHPSERKHLPDILRQEVL